MNKKNLFQLILVIILILIVFLFYKNFFTTKPKISEVIIKKENIDINNESSANVIENLKKKIVFF